MEARAFVFGLCSPYGLFRRTVAEQELAFRSGKRGACLIAQIVHTAEELAVHDEGQIAAFRGKGELVFVISGKRFVESHV